MFAKCIENPDLFNPKSEAVWMLSKEQMAICSIGLYMGWCIDISVTFSIKKKERKTVVFNCF